MAKEKESTVGSIVRTTIGFLSDQILPSITNRMEKMLDSAEERLLIIQQRLAQRVASQVFFLFAVVSLLAALFFFLVENLAISKAVAFLGIGVVFVIISYLFHRQSAYVMVKR
jgi:hypothetical protein